MTTLKETRVPNSPRITVDISQDCQYLTEAMLAKRWSISPRTLQNWRLKGGGPPYVKIGAAVRYHSKGAEDWLSRRVRKHTSDPGPDANGG